MGKDLRPQDLIDEIDTLLERNRNQRLDEIAPYMTPEPGTWDVDTVCRLGHYEIEERHVDGIPLAEPNAYVGAIFCLKRDRVSNYFRNGRCQCVMGNLITCRFCVIDKGLQRIFIWLELVRTDEEFYRRIDNLGIYFKFMARASSDFKSLPIKTLKNHPDREIHPLWERPIYFLYPGEKPVW